MLTRFSFGLLLGSLLLLPFGKGIGGASDHRSSRARFSISAGRRDLHQSNRYS